MCDMRRSMCVAVARTLLFSIWTALLLTSSAAEMTLDDIKNEGLACLDLATAMPILTDLIRKFIWSFIIIHLLHFSQSDRITIKSYIYLARWIASNKTKWVMSPLITSFANRAGHVVKADDINTRMTTEIEAVRLSSYSIQPTWCNFAGITCGSTVGTISYASIISIDLTRFSLRGQVPRSIGTFKSMTSLILSTNELDGTLPEEIEKLTSLQVLQLDDNEFSGSIPSGYGNLKLLTHLSLSRLFLDGSMPTSLCSLTALKTLSIKASGISNSIPFCVGELPLLTSIDLSRNILSGTIPSSLGKLISLNSLDLSNNILIGTIPHTFGELQTISELNLSNNKLSGTITTEISKLNKLHKLNLSKNHLTMGSAVQVPPSTFSITTLTSKLSKWDYNCFHWISPVWSNQIYLPSNCRDTGMYSIQYVNKCVMHCNLKYRYLSFLFITGTNPLL